MTLAIGFILAVSCAPRANKLLQEPTGRNAAEQAHLDTLRSFVGALGGPWRPHLPFDLNHLLQLDIGDLSDQEDAVAEYPAQVCCVVLTF